MKLKNSMGMFFYQHKICGLLASFQHQIPARRYLLYYSSNCNKPYNYQTYRLKYNIAATTRLNDSNGNRFNFSDKSKKTVKNIFGIGIGSIFGFLLTSNLEEKNGSSFKENLKLFHTVSAALPFINDNEKKEDKGLGNLRKKYNFIADVVEKVKDGVVFIEITDNRRLVKHIIISIIFRIYLIL